VEYRILGPFQLLLAGEPVRTPSGRSRDLLARLVVAAGRVVPSERLVDGLWGEALPANPDNALQQQVHQLRRHLDAVGGGGPVVTVRGGYRLDVPSAAVDAHRFERLVVDGRAAAAGGDRRMAAARLSAALGLWRGAPLEGIDAPWARAEARRLEQLRLTTWEERIDAELALGRHARVVGELERLVAAEPLRERLRGQLMLVFAGLGRQADALRIYAEGRQLLVGELGIDPSPALQRIHADVLAQRVPPAVPTGSGDLGARSAGRTPRLPTPASSFVGRDEDLRRVGALLADERLVTVVGPGGAGKTRLAVEVARATVDAAPEAVVHYVELASLTERAAVTTTLAAGIGVAGGKDVPVAEALRGALAAGRTLLVLDNCEHLLPAVSEVVHELVGACPDCRCSRRAGSRSGSKVRWCGPCRPSACPHRRPGTVPPSRRRPRRGCSSSVLARWSPTST
jgi:DNA-binding SARP family transcriptional activator